MLSGTAILLACLLERAQCDSSFFLPLFGDFTRSVSSVSTVTEEQTRVILTSFNCIFLACRCKPSQQARESLLSLP